ncbi:hypothetical protein KJ359_003201 [Pestalotiopsis sp. 9143b]|nr:hypothetical protein KJ359_003201 [Pestalotiopsis sp. 9143b]
MALDELATTSEATGPVATEGGQDANLEQQAKAATKTATNVASSSAANANQSAEMSVSIQRQDAETEAHDALRKAVQSIKALRSLATINLSDEFSQLSAIMSELSVLPKVSKNTLQEDETPADPPGEHDDSTFQSDLIVGQEDEVDLLFQVYAVTGGRRRLYRAANATPYRRRNEELEADDSPRAGIGTFTDVVIDCIQLHWDGDTLGPHRSTHRILHFTGEKRIVDFEYYPIQFRKNQQELRQQLSIRGRRVIDCYGHKKFDGQTAMAGLQYGILRNYANMHDISWTYLRHEMPQFFAETASRGRDLDSDVYVDMKNFCQMVPALKNEPYRLGRTRPSFREVTEGFEFEGDAHLIVVADHDLDVARSENFLSHNTHLSHPQRPEDVEGTEECLMLLGQCVPAFDFRSRKWDWLDVDKLEEIDKTHEARRRAWRDLVIEESYSQLLLSLVDNHTSAYDHKKKRNALGHGVPTTQVDLIQGKGRGLILLLHGPPGTGKTSTAEAIAAYTGKPLYAITCGDIGVTARDVENSLRRHTERAEKWGCVLLLDEADVFLARRTWTDMNRNAVVSGIIDEAFKSRIHVALRYDAIDLESTRRIWSNLLDRITKDNDTSDVRIKFDKDILLKFATTHFKKYIDDGTAWNARQIRNAFSTAIAMGQYDRMERIRKEGLTPDSVAASGNPGLMTIKLEKRNFAKVARTATEFEDYINAVRGDDARNALDSKQRDDYFAQQLAPWPRKNRGGTVYYGSGSKSAKGKKARTRPVDSEVEHDEEDEKPAVQKGKSKQRKDRFTDSEEGDSDESDGLSD